MAIGHSRAGNRQRETLIRPFHGVRATLGRTPVYVVTARTEALLLRLDKHRLARWLLPNGLANGPVPGEGKD